MSRILSLALLSLFALAYQAQHWSDVLKDREADFYEKQAAFYEEWAAKDYEKGKGYKQFKRWEWFWEQRVDQEGHFPEARLLWDEHQYIQREFDVENQSRSLGSWDALGPYDLAFTSYSPGLGRINIVQQSPSDPDVIYVGTPGGGLWRTNNGGNSWTHLTEGLPTLGVGGLAIHPTNPDIIYLGTGDGNADDTFSVGVLKSIDGGMTWETTGLDWQIINNRVSNKVIIHPTDHETVFLCSDAGLYRTTNGGDSWVQVRQGDFKDMEFHPTNPNIAYACTETFYLSSDGGASFSSISTGTPTPGNVSRLSIGVSPDEPNWVYLLAGDDDDQGYLGLWRSTDSGETFVNRSTSPNVFGWSQDGNDSGGQAWFCMALIVNPDNANQVTVGGVNLWQSNNGGQSWGIEAHWVFPSFTGTYVHADVHILEYFDGVLYAGTDGGIFRSTNNGSTFSDITPGMDITQFYRLGGSASDADIVLAGAQDNGIFLKEGSTWGQAFGADGMECAIHPTNPNIMFMSTQNGALRRSSNGGNSWTGWTDGINESGAWVTPFMLDPESPNVIWAGYESLWRRSGGGAWQQRSPSGGNITAFNIAPSDNDVIYLTRGSSSSVTFDGGENWDPIGGLPSGTKTSFAIHPEDPLDVYVTISGYSAGAKVYHSLDGGESWTNESSNLPNIPTNTVVREPGALNGVYVGMDVGVFYKNDDLTNWVYYSEGLPNTVVSELEIHEGSGKLRAATYGRGLWETDLFTGITQAPQAQFTADDLIICEGESVQFQDVSVFAAPGWDWTFEGGDPLSSDEQNPLVTYNSAGIYPVSITVENENGESTATEELYIKVVPLQGQEPPLVEGFEDINLLTTEEWFIENTDDDDLTWEINSSVGSGSSSSIFIDNYNNSPERDDELFSTTYDLSGAESAVLTFDVAYAMRFGDEGDRLRVYLSGNCGDSWSLKETLTTNNDFPSADPTEDPFIPAGPDEWRTITVDNFSANHFSDQFRVRFKMEADGGNNVYLDNINISTVSVGLDELNKQRFEFAVYPNPLTAASVVRFELTQRATVRYSIVDMAGRILKDETLGTLPGGEHLIPMTAGEWSAGIYTIQLFIDDAVIQERVHVE